MKTESPFFNFLLPGAITFIDLSVPCSGNLRTALVTEACCGDSRFHSAGIGFTVVISVFDNWVVVLRP